MKEENISKAVKAFLSPEKTKSLRKIAKEWSISSTIHGRVNGINPRIETNKDHRTLSKYQ